MALGMLNPVSPLGPPPPHQRKPVGCPQGNLTFSDCANRLLEKVLAQLVDKLKPKEIYRNWDDLQACGCQSERGVIVLVLHQLLAYV